MRLLLAACCWLLLLPCPAWAGLPHVMVVNSYHAEHPWVRAHNAALLEKLAGKARVTCLDLDTKRIPRSQFREAAERAWRAVLADRPDVVVLTDDNAVRLLGRRVMDGGIPLVFLGVNDNPRKYLGGMDAATGVLERPLFKRSLLYLQDILGPTLKRCLILFDRGETSLVIRETTFKNQTSLRLGKTDVDILFLDTVAQWREAILSARDKNYDIIFAGLYHSFSDEAGNHIPSDDILAWSSANSPVPLFGYWDFAVGKGRAVGGLVNSGRPQGEAAAELVLRILAGERPGSLYPVIPKDGQFVFSRYELQRWGILVPLDIIKADEPVLFVD
ncbi:ABC transporter substrate-binding protein [Pseudodesulfovibrio karagichevae]|uniref:ABC transporter substrate-binding protein n=1 Tax=Pseudodesulfovibrio karagichevae TaxID=3239305 RepID=A0ABV4K6L6_9BACT